MQVESRNGRVLLVAPQPFLTLAGTPLNVLQLCRALTELGYEVHLATLPMGKTVTMPNLVYHRVWRLPWFDHVPIGFSFRKAAYDVLLCAGTTALLMRHRFSAVHAIEEAIFYTTFLASLFRVPAVSDLDSDICQQLRGHGSAVIRSLARPARWLLRAALGRSACVVTVATPLTELVGQASPGTPVFEIRDIPIDAALRRPDAEQVEQLRRTFGSGSEAWIVYTGNLHQRQGVDLLLDAVALVVDRIPNAALLVVGGERAEIETLQRRAERLGIGERFRWAGKQPPESMPEFMGVAAVLVSPRLEPLITPLKIYSYMASGRPIVATDLPTHRAVLDTETAILVPPSAEGLAAGIMRALQSPAEAERLGRRAQQRVADEHSYERFKQQLADVYGFIAKQSSRCRPRRPA